MADTHEDSSRSDSGGSQAESKVEVSETSSRAEAFRSLIARGLQSSDSKVSLETRLGVITITILVFTFGFLIYRKVELHQQRLAAQIPPQGEQVDEQQVREALENPVVGLNPMAEPNPGEAETEDSPFNQFDQPAGSPSADNIGGMTEFETSNSGIEFSENSAPATAENQFPAESEPVEMVFDEPPVEVPSTELNPQDTVAATNESPFGEPEAAIATNEPSFEDSARPSGELGTGVVDEVVIPESTSALSTESSSPGDTGLTRDSEPPALSESSTPTLDFQPVAEEPSESPVAEEPVATQDSPPVLIAMLDPKPQENPFGPVEPEFPQFGDSAPAPASTPIQEEPAGSEPTLDFNSEPTPMPTSPALKEVPEENPFFAGSNNGNSAETASPVEASPFGGEPVVKRVVSPAVASGPDGKFSLAAFNYQNSVPAPIEDGNSYDFVTVQNGDNYSKISKRIYGTTRYFAALAVFNQHRISDPKKMRPGMKVIVPPAELLEERYPQLFQEAQAQRPQLPSGFFLNESGNPAYRVGTRETLSEISEKCLGRSSRWIEILRLNQHSVQDPNKLKPGTLLSLPDDAVEVNVSPQ